MSNRLAFPMYAVDRADTEALWQAVNRLLAARGVTLSEPFGLPEADLLIHWQQPDLILSQTCGYPLVTRLPDVQVVGAFHYAAPGCEGILYRSFLVAREADKHLTVADFRGRRLVCNSSDSQSGYNVLRKRIAPEVLDRYFTHVSFSGSHRRSLIEIKDGRADLAAIDCVTWALLQRHEPDVVAGLAVIEQSPLTPGLPLITSGETTPDRLQAIREALTALVSLPEYRQVCDAVLIRGFSAATREAWSPLLD